MAGYTRQSLATIINGANITAPPLNAEFNQISAAFNSSSGHSHDGTSGNSPKINLTTSVAGYLPAEHGGIGGKNKLDATTTPVVSNDNTEGYAPGSLWEDTTTGRIHICVGNSTGAAVWRELVQVESGNAILPAATDTVDLGNNSTRFQDLFLSGGISASGNVAAGGTLNITGATALGSTLGVTGDTTLVNLSATGTTTITSIDLNSGAIDSTTIGTTTPAAGTFTTLNANTSLVAATADINGGTVDGATIGASTPSTGSFTTLGASGTSTLATVDINGGNIDGTAIGASVQSTGAFTTVSTSGQATLATVDINGGSIDGTAIGGNSTSSGAFTTLSASGGITGDIVGNVTGNSSGTHTGAVVGNVTGNLTGNVTSSGTSSFNNVTVDGTLNMNAGTTATITNLTDPTNAQDAATKAYVDGEISTLIGDAGAGLNTLGELADALNDDDDFSTTVTNSIATKLPLAGGTLTGALAMSNNKVTGLGSPSVGTDASTKDYVDTQRNTRVAKTGDTMSGALAMGSNKITGLGTPTAGTDATTKTYVDNILGSATVASTSATNAATSESNAATSATNASNSATAAASSSASAAASLDSFDDRYLGAKSSAPTVDNDGDALLVGALYFDSTAGAMKVYSANGWTNAGSSVNGTSDRQTYTATAGQTVFSATYDAGYVDVYLNGVKLLAGTDFTATNGTSVTLASGASVNDVVDIVAYGTFVLADHLTETQSDAKYVQQTHTGNVGITGILSADTVSIQNDAASFAISSADLSRNQRFRRNGSNSLILDKYNGSTTTNTAKFDENGDISFYDGSGNAKFFWDASAETLDIGSYVGSAVNAPLNLKSDANHQGLSIEENNGTETWQLGVDVDGDLNFHNSGNATPSVSFSDSGSVGIGTSSPAEELDISADAPSMQLSSTNASGRNYGLQSTNNGKFAFYDGTAGVNRMVINSSGQVGIGTSSPENPLHVSNSTATSQILVQGDSNDASIKLNKSGQTFVIGIDATDDSFRIADNPTLGTNDRLVIDSSGNLLVGGTDINPGFNDTNTGSAIRSAGSIFTSVSGSTAGYFNRNTNSGEIISLRQDGASVGGIGTSGGDLTIYSTASGHCGLRFTGSGLAGTNNSGSISDATVDIGQSSWRFRDAYLSGGIFLGGTGAANKLEDYETGSWQPQIYYQNATNQSGATNVVQQGTYVKIGKFLHLEFRLDWTAPSGLANDNIGVKNLPFAAANNHYQGAGTMSANFASSSGLRFQTPNAGSTTMLVLTGNGSGNLGDDFGSGSGKFIRGTVSYVTQS